MSKVFFDHLIIFESLEADINKLPQSLEEKEEMWNLIDELIHHRIMGCVFDNLPETHHKEFIEKVHRCPFDEGIMDFLKQKGNSNIEDLIKEEVKHIEKEIKEEMLKK